VLERFVVYTAGLAGDVTSMCLPFPVLTILADAAATPPSRKWPTMCRVGR